MPLAQAAALCRPGELGCFLVQASGVLAPTQLQTSGGREEGRPMVLSLGLWDFEGAPR